jgi:hypothetical protein
MKATENDIYFSQQDSWYFIKNFCLTFDEHDKQNLKHFPDWDEIFPVFCEMAQGLLEKGQSTGFTQVMLVPKSRQLMISWISMAFLLWVDMFVDGSYCIVQSKKVEDSAYQLTRVEYMYDNLPVIFHDHVGKPGGRKSTKKFRTTNASWIEAVPSGGDVVRSRVPTVFFSDESAFQDDFDEAMKAGLANSSLIISVSSPNSGHFQRLVEDTDGEAVEGFGNLPDFEQDCDGQDESVDEGRETDNETGGVLLQGRSGKQSGRGWKMVR